MPATLCKTGSERDDRLVVEAVVRLRPGSVKAHLAAARAALKAKLENP
jgi:hypothetical protein